MREQEDRLVDSGIKTLLVTFDSRELALDYAEATKLEWPIIVDTKRQLYRAYGIPRATLWTLIKPAVTWNYMVTMFQGYRPGKPGCDLRQLGGNVLIDPNGIVRFNHVSTDPHDRPTAEYILETLA